VKALQKLTRNGNATAVTIPRAILAWLRWLPGEFVILEVLEDQSVLVRRPTERDIAPIHRPTLLYDNPPPTKP
jgi:antitoxin component of MazEF toxin-antitoxin module